MIRPTILPLHILFYAVHLCIQASYLFHYSQCNRVLSNFPKKTRKRRVNIHARELLARSFHQSWTIHLSPSPSLLNFKSPYLLLIYTGRRLGHSPGAGALIFSVINCILMQRDQPSDNDNDNHQVFHHVVLPHHNQRRKQKRRNKNNGQGSSTATRFSISAEDFAPSRPHTIASFITYSADGRRQFRQIEQVAAPPSLSTIFEDQEDITADPLPFLDEGLEPTVDDEPTNESTAKIRARRYLSSVSLKT